jgi:hypothetical protein
MMIDVVASLIAKSHSPAAADAYCSFTPDRAQLQALASVGVEVLRHFPPMPGACAVMSAVWAARWQQVEKKTPVYVVAGALLVGAERVFGDESVEIDGAAAFGKSDPSWDGHCWLAFGGYVADVSIFRTAYSAYSPPALARHVIEQFGRGRGLQICTADDAAHAGFQYRPQYVLTDDQITGLFLGARSIVLQERTDQPGA